MASSPRSRQSKYSFLLAVGGCREAARAGLERVGTFCRRKCAQAERRSTGKPFGTVRVLWPEDCLRPLLVAPSRNTRSLRDTTTVFPARELRSLAHGAGSGGVLSPDLHSRVHADFPDAVQFGHEAFADVFLL